MKNPVILGVAATNRPHVRLREHPMSVVERNGKKMVRVPFMVKGKYRHPLGPLDFNDEVFKKMIDNHKNKVGDFGEGLDVKHIPDLGSLAWFDPDKGGEIVIEDNTLVGYGVPTGDDSLAFIENEKFRWASVEFHPDYKSTLEKTYLESTSIDSAQLTLDEETIQLGNPYRDAFGRWASKAGGAVKKAGKNFSRGAKEGTEKSFSEMGGTSSKAKGAGRVAGRVAHHAKELGSGVKEGAKSQVTWRGGDKLVAKNKTTKPSKTRKAGQVIGALGTHAAAVGAVIGAGVAADKYKKKYGWNARFDALAQKRRSKLEYQPITLSNDLQPTLAREALKDYVSNGGQEDFLWFDTEVFDWGEMNLPIEEGHYKVDKQTASEMLAALDELAQEQPALFYTEDDMQTLDEALARIEELETELQALRTEPEEMTEREKELIARVEQLERSEVEKTVKLEIETARNYKDGEGRGHSAVVLNFIGDLMLGKPIGEIKLESYTDPAAIGRYFRDGLAEFLRTAPGTQPVESKTVGDEKRTLEAADEDLYLKGKEASKSFWG